MINKNRVVPVKATDLISLYGTIVKLADSSHTYEVLDPVGGELKPTNSAQKYYLASEPVKYFDFAGATADCDVYFVADYGFEGFKQTVAAGSATVDPESAGLYKAFWDYSETSVTVTRITPAAN